MPALDLTTEEANQLVDELAAALEEMMDCTCVEMGPLWAEATREQRAHLDSHAVPDLGFTPSLRYQGLSKGARSKYRGLAAWRHAVIWRRVDAHIDAKFRVAMRAVYFTPFPENAPPYAWSSRGSGAPGVEAFPSATTLKDRAKQGCWQSVNRLRRERCELETGTWANGLRAMLLTPATRDSLREVLKLDDRAMSEEGR